MGSNPVPRLNREHRAGSPETCSANCPRWPLAQQASSAFQQALNEKGLYSGKL